MYCQFISSWASWSQWCSMKPSVTRNKNYFPYILLFVQPVFMATNIIVARGGVEYVPPISLAFWRWLTVFLLLLPFFYNEIIKNKKSFNKEFWKLFFLGSMGCGVCGAFPFIAGMSKLWLTLLMHLLFGISILVYKCMEQFLWWLAHTHYLRKLT